MKRSRLENLVEIITVLIGAMILRKTSSCTISYSLLVAVCLLFAISNLCVVMLQVATGDAHTTRTKDGESKIVPLERSTTTIRPRVEPVEANKIVPFERSKNNDKLAVVMDKGSQIFFPYPPQVPRLESPHLERIYNLTVIEQKPEDFLFPGQCSKISINNFVGRQTTIKLPVDVAKLIQSFPEIENGHFAPENCTSDEKLAIIIPFRNRQKHLYTLLPVLFPMLIRQGVDFTVFVIEQDLPSSFNKGVVYNAGFLEALKLDNYSCFMFHDVDMLPLSDLNMYRCEQRGPLHFVSGVNKFHYKLLYDWLIGGVLGFTREQFKKVNGFSNLYFGWGSEDDDMRLRVHSTNMTMYRRPKLAGMFDMIYHGRDKRWKPNPGRFNITKMARYRTQEDGLNNVKYTLTHFEMKPLFVHVRIAVKMTDVFDSAPAYMKEYLEIARIADLKNREKEGTLSEKGYT